MDVQIPSWLNDILEFLVGQRWPVGSEGGLRAHSAEWASLRDALDTAREKVVQQRSAVPDVLSGSFADGVDESLRNVIENIDSLRDTAEEMRKALKNGAADLGEAKAMVLVQLALLAIQLAWLIASLFGALAIPAAIAGTRAIITAVLRQIFVEVAQELAQEPLLMLLIQAIQNHRDYREGINWDAIRNATIQTIIQAGAAGLTNFGAQSLVRWGAGRWARIDRALPDGTVFIKNHWTFRAGAIATKGGAQAAVAIPAELAGQAAVGAPIEVRWGTATSAFVSGMHESNAATTTELKESVNLPSATGWDRAYRPLPDDEASVVGEDQPDTIERKLPRDDNGSVYGDAAESEIVDDDATLGDDDSVVSDDEDNTWIGEVGEQRLLGDDGSSIWSDRDSQDWATDDEDDRLLDHAASNVLSSGGIPGLLGLGTGLRTQQQGGDPAGGAMPLPGVTAGIRAGFHDLVSDASITGSADDAGSRVDTDAALEEGNGQRQVLDVGVGAATDGGSTVAADRVRRGETETWLTEDVSRAGTDGQAGAGSDAQVSGRSGGQGTAATDVGVARDTPLVGSRSVDAAAVRAVTTEDGEQSARTGPAPVAASVKNLQVASAPQASSASQVRWAASQMTSSPTAQAAPSSNVPTTSARATMSTEVPEAGVPEPVERPGQQPVPAALPDPPIEPIDGIDPVDHAVPAADATRASFQPAKDPLTRAPADLTRSHAPRQAEFRDVMRHTRTETSDLAAPPSGQPATRLRYESGDPGDLGSRADEEQDLPVRSATFGEGVELRAFMARLGRPDENVPNLYFATRVDSARSASLRDEARRLLDAGWREQLAQAPDVPVLLIGGSLDAEEVAELNHLLELSVEAGALPVVLTADELDAEAARVLAAYGIAAWQASTGQLAAAQAAAIEVAPEPALDVVLAENRQRELTDDPPSIVTSEDSLEHVTRMGEQVPQVQAVRLLKPDVRLRQMGYPDVVDGFATASPTHRPRLLLDVAATLRDDGESLAVLADMVAAEAADATDPDSVEARTTNFTVSLLKLLDQAKDGPGLAEVETFVTAKYEPLEPDFKLAFLEAIGTYQASRQTDVEKAGVAEIAAAIMRCR